MIANVVSWTHEPPRYMHALFLESCWIHHSSLQFPEAGSASLFFFARQCRIHWNFQLSPCVFDGFLKFPNFRIDERYASQPSSIIEFGFLVCPFLLFSFLSGFSNFGPYFWTHILRSGSCLIFCQSPSGPHISFGGFSFKKVICVNPFQESDKLRFTSTFLLSPSRFSCNTSRIV